jgi:CHASE1-domain containing sensor protein
MVESPEARKSVGRHLAAAVPARQCALMAEPNDNDREPDSRRPALIGLALVLLLVVVAYFLVTALQKNADLEDCLMAGRRNCAPIEVPSSGR